MAVYNARKKNPVAEVAYFLVFNFFAALYVVVTNTLRCGTYQLSLFVALF